MATGNFAQACGRSRGGWIRLLRCSDTGTRVRHHIRCGTVSGVESTRSMTPRTSSWEAWKGHKAGGDAGQLATLTASLAHHADSHSGCDDRLTVVSSTSYTALDSARKARYPSRVGKNCAQVGHRWRLSWSEGTSPLEGSVCRMRSL